MSKGPYGEINDWRSIEERCRNYIKENLSIQMELISTGYDYYDSEQTYKRIEVILFLKDEVVSRSVVDIAQ